MEILKYHDTKRFFLNSIDHPIYVAGFADISNEEDNAREMSNEGDNERDNEGENSAIEDTPSVTERGGAGGDGGGRQRLHVPSP